MTYIISRAKIRRCGGQIDTSLAMAARRRPCGPKKITGLGHQVPAMQTRKKKQPSPDWPFTMEQIGRELREVYRRPERLTGRLRALVRRLEIRSERERRSQQREG
jgi:hypothetical protein